MFNNIIVHNGDRDLAIGIKGNKSFVFSFGSIIYFVVTTNYNNPSKGLKELSA